MDSSSDTSPFAPSIPSNNESQNTTTTQTRNVTPVTPSKTPRSQIPNTTSITPLLQIDHPYLNHNPLVHIPHSVSVERYVNYKQPTSIKNVRLQSHFIHIPDTEYPTIPSLQLPSEMNKTISTLHPPIKLLRKPSTSLSNLLESSPSISNLLDDASDYIPSQEPTSSLFVTHQRYNLRNLHVHSV